MGLADWFSGWFKGTKDNKNLGKPVVKVAKKPVVKKRKPPLKALFKSMVTNGLKKLLERDRGACPRCGGPSIAKLAARSV